MISSSAAAGSRLRDVERGQRLVDDAEELEEVLLVRLEIQNAGREFASARYRASAQRAHLVRRVVVLCDLRQQELRSVVQRDSVVVPGSYSTLMSSK
jgi:hypothetical protein